MSKKLDVKKNKRQKMLLNKINDFSTLREQKISEKFFKFFERIPHIFFLSSLSTNYNSVQYVIVVNLF